MQVNFKILGYAIAVVHKMLKKNIICIYFNAETNIWRFIKGHENHYQVR